MKIVRLQKVYSDGKHNAFTGMAFYRGRFHLAFRNASHHGISQALGPSHGRQVVLTSEDGETWSKEMETVFPVPAGLPAETLMDARDNYFLDLGHELQLYSFVLSPLGPDGDFLVPPSSTVQTTQDGKSWSEPKVICSGAILWKPIFFQGEWLCAGYRRVEGSRFMVDFYRSGDGLAWTRVAPMTEGNETCLHPVSEHCLRAYVRTDFAPCHMKVLESEAPFTEWRLIGTIPKIIRGPHIFSIDGRLILFGRELPPSPDCAVRPATARTRSWELNGCDARPLLEFPSLGDTAYAGAVRRPDGLLLVSYYSQHERETEVPQEERGGNDKPADIFVALMESF